MPQLNEEYLSLRKEILDGFFSRMNPMQRQAVFTVNGPVLILAGAGSGKTTVLINRVLNLVRFGDAYSSTAAPDSLTDEDLSFLRGQARRIKEGGAAEPEETRRMAALLAHNPQKPYHILCITFTNKAAGELRDRLAASLGGMAQDVNAATFHSACVRMLRRGIDRLGYSSSFTIYDTDDCIRIIKKLMDVQNMGESKIKPRSILTAISRAKDQMLSPQQLLARAGDDFFQQFVAKIYLDYQKELKSANAVDFDDIILLTVHLLEECPDVLEYYRQRYRYIMVDEYQDTNALQYRLISLLASGHQNLCVVGDDDQSIYKFRGATIENILSFEEQFPGAKVIRLEQNYRSTKTILGAANEVIKNNTQRKGKNLWTENGEGGKVKVYKAPDEQSEAAYICETIGKNIREGARFADHAVLYRLNAQSNALERELTRNAIPYKIIGGLRFYERKEIKDAISYLSVINNPDDTLRLTRIIHEPKRGIGEATIQAAASIAVEQGVPLFEVLRRSDEYQPLARKALSLLQFTHMIEGFIQDNAQGMPPDLLFDRVMEESGYMAALMAQQQTEQTRIENLGELKGNIQRYIQENEDATLSGFLEEIALYTDLDSYNDSDDRVILMTIHSAKGLEFDHVFVAGAEEGIFPGSQSAFEPSLVQEERRLAYVAYTRAKKDLAITCCGQRMLFGSTMRNQISRFVKEIPSEYVDYTDPTLLVRNAKLSAGAKPMRNIREERAKDKRTSVQLSAVAHKPSKAAAGLVLQTGDRVMHSVYGAGVILSAKPMGGDQLLEIEFDTAGKKKVMQNFAKLAKA